ncbi:hypothetical protein OE749_17310 [Aestuariibacter sp. AA17]|uniref:Uncharacterized protein n=1 Tax=Fluctibacter corallii TaxID=2984329 RepID=A0ABT3AD14_9ALTE|nr:hypothetical protein [Aestuariibacter sp. AA17]MCV2886457.1 hypothetical protein [Aestuariibacter sp. AA17]
MNYKLLNYLIAILLIVCGVSNVFLRDSASFAIPFMLIAVALYIGLTALCDYRGGVMGYIGCFALIFLGTAFVHTLSYPSGAEFSFLNIRNTAVFIVGMVFIYLGMVRNRKLKNKESMQPSNVAEAD